MTSSSSRDLSEIQELVAKGRFAEAYERLPLPEVGPSSMTQDVSAEVTELRFLCLHHLGRWNEIVDLASTWISPLAKSGSARTLVRVHASTGIACLRLGRIRKAELRSGAAVD